MVDLLSTFGRLLGSILRFWGHFWAPGDAKGSPKGAQGAPGKAKREPRDVIFRKSGLIGNVCFLLVLIGSGAHGRGRRAPKEDQEELGCHLWGGSASKKEAHSETKCRFLAVDVFCVFSYVFFAFS